MRALFADLPQAIASTLELSSRLEFTLNDLGYEFPRYPVPDGETMVSFLREHTREGMQSRYGRAGRGTEKARAPAIERELNLIEHLKLAGYFLIVWDLVRFCASRTFWRRAADRPPTARCATRSALRRSIRSAWNCCSNAFFPRSVANGPTSISICQRQRARARDPVRLSTLRTARSGHDRQRDYLSQSHGRARNGKVMGFDEDTLKRISAAVATWEFKDENDALDRRLRDAASI